MAVSPGSLYPSMSCLPQGPLLENSGLVAVFQHHVWEMGLRVRQDMWAQPPDVTKWGSLQRWVLLFGSPCLFIDSRLSES